MKADTGSFIGTVEVNPEDIAADGAYIIQCPEGAVFLAAGRIENRVLLWVMVPEENNAIEEVVRLYVVPGGRGLRAGMRELKHIGTVLIDKGDEHGEFVQDWHIFHDTSGMPITQPPQSKYTLH